VELKVNKVRTHLNRIAMEEKEQERTQCRVNQVIVLIYVRANGPSCAYWRGVMGLMKHLIKKLPISRN